MTNHNVQQADLRGEPAITGECIQNNTSVRRMLSQRGIKLENLPPAEDIKKLERRVQTDEEQLVENSGRLPEGNPQCRHVPVIDHDCIPVLPDPSCSNATISPVSSSISPASASQEDRPLADLL